MQADNYVDFTQIPGQQGDLAMITLQRTAALNALTDPMVRDIYLHLTHWANNPSIKAIIIRAVPGRAFCAGGDIRSIYNKKLAHDPTLGDFFWDEYQLNRAIFHLKKPYIAIMDGITMGGGVGISIHGSHRIATPNMSFSMPETGIGYFPDIGASYFLPRLPHYIGYYLGLTGERITYQDCLALGITDTIIAADTQDSLIKKLADTALPDATAVTSVIQSFSIPSSESSLWTHHKEIEKCFVHQTVEEIIFALQNEGTDWCTQTAAIIQTKSPTSLKVTLRSLQKGHELDFDSCMQMEERLARHFMSSHDLFEGIRAAVVDKDRKPEWEPATLSTVTSEYVENYFK